MNTSRRKTEQPDGSVLVHIGMCAGGSDASSHVEAVLAAAGIQPVVHGSRAYAIEVLEPDVLRATELLRTDPRREHYGITVFEA